MEEKLSDMTDDELQVLAVSIPVSDPRFREVWTAHETRNRPIFKALLKYDEDTLQALVERRGNE